MVKIGHSNELKHHLIRFLELLFSAQDSISLFTKMVVYLLFWARGLFGLHQFRKIWNFFIVEPKENQN